MKAEQIVKAITASGGIKNIREAESALVMLYIPDLTIPRPEIIKAGKLLKEKFKEQ